MGRRNKGTATREMPMFRVKELHNTAPHKHQRQRRSGAALESGRCAAVAALGLRASMGNDPPSRRAMRTNRGGVACLASMYGKGSSSGPGGGLRANCTQTGWGEDGGRERMMRCEKMPPWEVASACFVLSANLFSYLLAGSAYYRVVRVRSEK